MKRYIKFLPVGIILALWVLFAYPYWGKGLVPFPSTYLVTFFPPWSAQYGMPVKNNAMPDVITQIYPWKDLTIDTWKSGAIPLWNPYSFGGTSHAANYQSAVFSPFNLLFFVLPQTDAWSVLVLLQPILAGAGMYIFLTSLGLSRISRATGSLAFMFCGFITVWMAYGTLAYAALWLPLALFFVRMHQRGKPWAAPFVSVVLALSFLSGHFQISLYVFLMTGAYSLYTVFENTRDRWRNSVLLAAVPVGALLAAFQIFPSLEAYTGAVRSGLFQKGEIIPWNYLVTLFAPDFFGNPVTRNDWFGHYAEWAGFVGVVPLFLSVFAVLFLYRKNAQVKFFGFSALVSLMLAVPSPLNDLMYAVRFPVLSTSAASRIIVLFSFSLSALAALGADGLFSRWNGKVHKKDWLFIVLFIAGLAVLWAWLLLTDPMPAGRLSVAVRNTVLPTGMLVSAIAVYLSGFVLKKRRKKAALMALMILTAFDMYRYASKWMPFDPKEFVYPRAEILSELTTRTKDSQGRVFGNLGGEASVYFDIPLIEGYDAVYQARYGEFIRSAETGKPGIPERSVVQLSKNAEYTNTILNLMGVRYLAHRISDGRQGWAFPHWNYPEYTLVWKDETYELYENAKALPRAFLASSYVRQTSGEGILHALFSGEIDPEKTVVLENEPEIQPAEGEGTAEIVRYRENRVEIRTDSRVPKLLFLSDVYDTGWHAAVDSKPSSLYRANYTFRAVSIPAGTHTVTMWYWPQSLTYGLLAAVFGTLWSIGIFVIQKKRAGAA